MLRFNPAAPLDITPHFVRWTLSLACPLRELTDPLDPDVTERLLRGVRCVSDAIADQRRVGDVVLQQGFAATPPGEVLGFRCAAVLEPFGGENAVHEHCSACPANALQRLEPAALAGCVGHLVPPSTDDFHSRFDTLVAGLPDAVEALPSTRPRWFGLWINQRPTPSEMQLQRQILAGVAEGREVVGLADYLAALATAVEHDLPLVVRAYPGGRCQDRRWTVDPHCSRCKTSWHEARRQQCRVCGQMGGRVAERVRKRMGTRPYRPLRQFLSAAEIAAVFEQYSGRESLAP